MWLNRFDMRKTFFALSVLAALICSCKQDNQTRKKDNSPGDEFITTSLLKGDYSRIDEDISLAVFENSIFFFSKGPNGFSDDEFLLQLISKDKPFLNLHFDADQTRLAKESLGAYRNLDVLYFQWNEGAYSHLRIVQHQKTTAGIKNNWEIKIDLKSAVVRPNLYKNEFFESIGKHLRQKDFRQKLENGIFFKIRHNFHILQADDLLYLITDKNQEINDKFMLHFIPEQGEFTNLSFHFKNKEYQDFLLSPYNDFRIARVKLPENFENFEKLRIGQFNKDGNTWVQVMTIEDILANVLLRYQGELNNPLNDK